jgi:hypothetical protein
MKIKNPIYPWRKSSLRIVLLPCLMLLSLTTGAYAQNSTATNEGAIDVEAALALPSLTPLPVCSRTIKANVVALDQIIMFNRLLNSNGHMRNNLFNLHGHFWQDEPFTNNSKAIGNNPLSEFKGVQYGIGPSSHYEVIPVNRAGGARQVTGDYLWRTQESFMFDGGNLGHFPRDAVGLRAVQLRLRLAAAIECSLLLGQAALKNRKTFYGDRDEHPYETHHSSAPGAFHF